MAAPSGGNKPPPAQEGAHSVPRRKGLGNQNVCGGRCFLISLALAVLLVTILQYSFSVSNYGHHSDLWHSSTATLRAQFAASFQDSSREGVSRDRLGGRGGSKPLDRYQSLGGALVPDVVNASRPAVATRPKPYITRASNPPKNIQTAADPHYYMIFSTSCTPLQHWQSYLLFYSAYKVGQLGNVTRIVSGCKPDDAAALEQFHKDYIRPMSEHFHVHFTPDFAAMHLEHGKHPYKYMNKPFGVRHWLENALGLGRPDNVSRPVLDSIVMLLDPDMVLLRPLRHDFTHEEVLWVDPHPRSKVVRHGYQIAQQDAYLGNTWMHLNWTHVTGLPKGKYLEPPLESKDDGPRIWNSGPPYLATVQDMYQIAQRWTSYSPRALDLKSDIYAEMYGYIIASYQLRLPHSLIKSIVVSDTETVNREGWKYIDQLSEDRVCRADDVPMPPSTPMPIGLHYCQRYMLGEYFFVKYRVKKNNFDCSKPLYAVPPKDFMRRYNYTVIPMRADLHDQATWEAKRVPISPKQVKREAFMLCRMIPYLNEALRYYKDHACGKDRGNLNETISVYVDPSDW